MSVVGGCARRARCLVEILGTAGMLLGVTLLFGAGPSWAGTNPRLARVAGLRSGTVVRHVPLHLVVRLAPGVTSFSAHLDATDVTGRFRRAAGGVREAWIRPGRATGLRWGLNHLTVRTRRGRAEDFDAVRFWVGRGLERLVTGGAPPHALPGQVPVALRLPRRGTHLRVHLNGHRVTGLRARGRRRTMTLDRDDGLRPGHNRLRILAYHRDGWADLDRRRFTISRRRPVIGAGRDRRVAKGRRARLRARAVVGAGPPEKLRYRWQVVRRPHASHPRLRHPHSARPWLRPDALGRYRLRLTVTRTLRDGRRVHASDSVTVSSAPDSNPVGIPIDVGPSGPSGPWEVSLGDPVNTVYPPKDGGVWQLVVLDRTTLQLQENESFAGGDSGTWALYQEVQKLSNADLVIITTSNAGQGLGGGQGPDGQYSTGNMNAALKLIHGAPLPSYLASSSDGFTAIGIFGGGTATENPGLSLLGSDGRTGAPGELRGYLQGAFNATAGETYHYVSGDNVTFDTHAPGSSATQAVISVGGSEYTSQQVPTAGFFVLILDSGTLKPVDQGTFTDSYFGMTDMDEMLSKDTAGDPDPRLLVMVQSIGNVKNGDWPDNVYPDNPYDRVGDDLQHLGGSSLVFAQLGSSQPPGSYAQVGPGDPSAGGCCPSSEVRLAGSAFSGHPARLTGLLMRDASSQFVPTTAGPEPAFSHTAPRIIYQPPVSWPLRDTPAHNAAIACIAAAVGLPPGPIERNYWADESENSGAWASDQATLNALDYDHLPAVSACDTAGFAAADFSAVKAQLQTEFHEVAIVKSYVESLQSDLQSSSLSSYANFQQYVSDVTSSVDVPNVDVGANSAEVMSDVFYVFADSLPGLDWTPFGALGTLFSIASDASVTPTGDPAAPIEAVTSDLGAQLANRYETMLGNLGQAGDMLVSDWGKLQAAFNEVNSDWAIGQQQMASLTGGLQLSTHAWAYKQLIPLVYRWYDFSPAMAPADYSCVDAHPPGPSTFNPFQNAPANDAFQVQMPYPGQGPEWWILANSDTSFLTNEGITPTPSAGLVNDMFGGDPPPLTPLRLALRYPGPVTLTTDTRKVEDCEALNGATRARSAARRRGGASAKAVRPAPAPVRPRAAPSGTRR